MITAQSILHAPLTVFGIVVMVTMVAVALINLVKIIDSKINK